ncbi:phosphatidylinositol/phosphatidylcholine transfer protein SFH12-like [Solanum verrucosum]|uniref:phosphatidylinositol/phosphatidylcholine transfer protein SFH12-like n=1 Tax=Solanum verrucosum TaxID=315347 RepID=UPI0020D06EF9|nr:phosphatidylinositol/phosphatidylcholine transfer protein SFH12-like [Solanum verrucosum]XP_049355047.1 phosphatidylinositol/phosphatidylcholine transfer protein SFH12-like [Solanum verrucosum]XP_049355049.1 phosphatidylinositol/phosphatidylcholine transfer protein SFH12-like [Solanum verrucosum]
MGDLPCPPYSNKSLEARMISKEKLPKICLVASATKHFSAKTLKCITKVKHSVQTSGAAGDIVIFLATTAVLEVVRRLSKARCPFIWHGLQALQALCYPPLKWIQKWVPLEPLVGQLQKLSRPMLLLSIATVFSDQSSSTGETTPNDFHHSQAYPQARSHDEVQDDGYPQRWLLELHKELREEGISVPERLNDDELRQFYAAANGDFARLLSSVKKTIKWRQSYTFLSPEELKAWSPFIFWHGHDANQRPCLIISLGLACSNLRSNGKSLLIKAVVSQIEHGILRMVNVEHPQITVLMDCEGLSPFGFPIHMMRSCAMLLQDHYPNRLSSLIIARLPQVAQIIMQTFFQVLKPATRQKVRIIGRNHLEFLSNHLDSIPPFLGGNCSCSKCSDQTNAEGESDEATRTEPTPDQASRPETHDHVNESDEVTLTEPAPDQVKDSTELNHHNVSNTSVCREELIKTIIIGILMVWVFIAVFVAMDYPERWPLLRST